MAQTSREGRDGQEARPTTLAQMLFPLSDPEQRRQLEKFRLEFERVHGPTDLTRRYTSTWPAEEQVWLRQHDLSQYFNGLPTFAQAWLHAKMKLAASSGNLDGMPDAWIELFAAGGMREPDAPDPTD